MRKYTLPVGLGKFMFDFRLFRPVVPVTFFLIMSRKHSHLIKGQMCEVTRMKMDFDRALPYHQKTRIQKDSARKHFIFDTI